MPCYTVWYEGLRPDTSDFASAKQAVEVKLRAVVHVIDYYYAAGGMSLPVLPDGVAIDPMRQPRSPKEYGLREVICHHLACDGIDFMDLFNVATLLDEQNKDQRAHLAVIRPCALLMKQYQAKFVVAYTEAR
jgi:hypothetical protein